MSDPGKIRIKTLEEIGREREQESIDADRADRRLVSTALWCWGFAILGAFIMAPAFHIHALFEGQRNRAEAFMHGGLLVGTGGPLAVLIRAWLKSNAD